MMPTTMRRLRSYESDSARAEAISIVGDWIENTDDATGLEISRADLLNLINVLGGTYEEPEEDA